MTYRFKYAGAMGLLFTLGCGPQVEIGRGSGGGAGDGAAGDSGVAPQAGEGGTDGMGDAGAGPMGGTAGGDQGGTTSTGGTHVGGPIPTDDGPQTRVDKLDLLIAVDNSISMAEKQQLFVEAMPELVKRLISPPCVTDSGTVTAEPTSPNTACPAGSAREFAPLRDLHVGVITSSLGSHGASGVRDVCVGPEDNDYAHLLGSLRELPSYNNKGYLKWDPDGISSPPGEDDAENFANSLGAMIQSAGEGGCGYEAQLESVYRFLVDPAPHTTIAVNSGTSQAEKVGVDAELLAQRAAFLRPDSSVAVVILTDENDCSIVDEGYGYLAARSQPMFRATSACLEDPNDPCCQSCGEVTPNPGCDPPAEDVECQKGQTLDLADDEDDLNLRCFDQKRRFGFSLLYPLERYVSGFGGGTVRNREGRLVPNPLFHRDGVVRDPSLFTLAVVGGVPWQDIATSDSLTGEKLQYLSATELAAGDRWNLIVGDPEGDVPPGDPFMRESPEPRSGTNPITGAALVPPTSTNPTANPINGHEQNYSGRDLQYACTFPLPEPIVCDQAREDSAMGCDCFESDLSLNRPQCQPPGGGEATTTQYYGRAYPALRELAVASQLGRRTVLGSVCARNTQDETRSDYGYRPLFDALGRRLASTLVKP